MDFQFYSRQKPKVNLKLLVQVFVQIFGTFEIHLTQIGTPANIQNTTRF